MPIFDPSHELFHDPETLIYRDSDGTWLYWCPRCGEGVIPTRKLQHLRINLTATSPLQPEAGSAFRLEGSVMGPVPPACKATVIAS